LEIEKNDGLMMIQMWSLKSRRANLDAKLNEKLEVKANMNFKFESNMILENDEEIVEEIQDSLDNVSHSAHKKIKIHSTTCNIQSKQETSIIIFLQDTS
jgi:hypothetical protein